MDPTIRPAVHSDQEAIAAFTAATFEWGDYIAEVFDDWLADEAGQVMVAADENNRAIAIGRGAMLSPTEAWLQGARVSPAWRRRGLATRIGEALVEWARDRGALVARLGTEDWNVAAQGQVEAGGFRPVGEWVVATREIKGAEPATSSNGGKRAQARRKLKQAHSSEAVPAWVSWRSGPLVQPSRGLHSWHWRWARLELEHLEQAARDGELWFSQAGWAYVRTEEERLSVGWLDCGPDDASDMVRSLVDLAIAADAARLQIATPRVDWLESALAASALESHPMVIYERAL